MMRASWKAYVLSILVLVGGVAVLRASYSPASRDSDGSAKKPPTLEDLQAQLRERNLQVARSEESEIFLRKDVAEIERRLTDAKNGKEAVKLIKAGIYLLDREALKGYAPDEQHRLYDAILKYVTDTGAGSKGNTVHAASLAIRLLGKLPEPAPGSLARKRTLELLDPALDSRRTMLVIETLSRWKTLPAEARSRIEKDLLSSDAHVSRSAIQLISQVRDPKAKAELLNVMAERYSGLSELARPLALKVWVIFGGLIRKDYSRELAKAKEREGEYWEDAAISAIERIGVTPEHERYLTKLQSRTTNPLTHQRISALLGRRPAKESGGGSSQ